MSNYTKESSQFDTNTKANTEKAFIETPEQIALNRKMAKMYSRFQASGNIMARDITNTFSKIHAPTMGKYLLSRERMTVQEAIGEYTHNQVQKEKVAHLVARIAKDFYAVTGFQANTSATTDNQTAMLYRKEWLVALVKFMVNHQTYKFLLKA